jgi:manganese/zinc/iron transport system permease protein
VIIAGFFHLDPMHELSLTLLVMGGAAATALLGLSCIAFLERRMKVKSDSALCFILATFFGIGLTLASHVQFSYTSLYRQVVLYLYGQAATMTDVHILVYGLLALAIVAMILLFYKELQAITFDRSFAKTLGLPVHSLDLLLFVMIVLAIVIGIRSVGVVLMSAMLIAPAVAARQYTNHFGRMLLLAALFGVASGFFGNYLSVEMGRTIGKALPTGPMIVLVASFFCIIALLLAPERGLLLRLNRVRQFRNQCARENMLKALWRYGEGLEVAKEELQRRQNLSYLAFKNVIWHLKAAGWIGEQHGKLMLTQEGWLWAARIVRLHRLWEVYLADYLGIGAERVHYSAEEMEHIITPQLEEELTLLLRDPQRDPHHQPIPPKL